MRRQYRTIIQSTCLTILLIISQTALIGCGGGSGSSGQNVEGPAANDEVSLPDNGSDAPEERAERLVKTTAFGTLSGYRVENSGVLAWRGIPFAAPPVGNLRWQAPRDPAPWSGTRSATRSGPPCLQFEMSRTYHQTGEIVGSEDCLYLDIYRPDTDAEDLPVYFWIHGGSNTFGGAAEYAEYAVSMAEDLEVVVVVTQYRLGPFGWFRYAGLRDNTPENASNSGNFGTLDQIKALTWVRENIAEFGGNPQNITIAGQSAGGHNVKNLLISPLAAGLFHRAVSESGIMSVVPANDNTAETVIQTLRLEGEDIAGQLRRAGAEAVLKAGRGENYSAFIDGYVIPNAELISIANGNYNPVPVILGYNEKEYFNLLTWYFEKLGKPEWDNVYDLFDPDFDPDHQWTYRELFPEETDEEALYQLAGNYASMSCRAKYLDEFATFLSNRQDQVYCYVFQWAGGDVSPMEAFSRVFGAAHSMEIPFFFGSDHSYFGYSFIAENETGRKALQEVMQTYLYNFMITGDPGTADDGTPWNAWSNREGFYKAITFDADAMTPQLGYIQDVLTFEEVERYLASQLSGLDPADAAVWKDLLPLYFRQQPESTP